MWRRPGPGGRARPAGRPPGSRSMAVTGDVEPTANTLTAPVRTSERRTIEWTPSVRSTIAPLAGVVSRSGPPWTGSLAPDPQPAELALAHLQDRPVEAL